jgi:pimeloyl-ACP methyl ester carboxylesterase
MPVVSRDGRRIDYSDEGTGTCVLLLHSSAAGRHQWQRLAAEFAGHRRVVAPNLFGYGTTSTWEEARPQRVADQARLVEALVEDLDGPIDLVGHSFGALVALEVAARLGPRAGRMVLFEPNAFALLDQAPFENEYHEALILYLELKRYAQAKEWPLVAARFADYFSGDRTWASMPTERRAALALAVTPNHHEWDAAMDPSLREAAWLNWTPPTLLVWAKDTRAPLRAVARHLVQAHPGWASHELERGGHLAPIMRPRAFNTLARNFVDGH